MSLYIDLTEFLTNPVRTGIQRIEGEICKHLPDGTAVPVRLHSGQYFTLPQALIGSIGRYFQDEDRRGTAEIRRLGDVANAETLRLKSSDTVLVPEVFYDQHRLAYFRRMSDAVLDQFRFIVCDLLPVTNPEYFSLDMPLDVIHGYFQLIRRSAHCGFISESTRDVYYSRLKRTGERGGVVLSLGSDGLGPRGSNVEIDRPLKFSVIGTIEPRKNHALILEAFEPLLQQIDDLRLCFIGQMGWVEPDFANKLRLLSADRNSGFEFHERLNDMELRGNVQQSRATIYISAAEGYGLPSMESLWLGTPVIASSFIPSLRRIGTAGVEYVEPLSAANLRQAVLKFVDTAYANRKIEQAASLSLPTWKSLTDDVLSWCGQN